MRRTMIEKDRCNSFFARKFQTKKRVNIETRVDENTIAWFTHQLLKQLPEL